MTLPDWKQLSRSRALAWALAASTLVAIGCGGDELGGHDTSPTTTSSASTGGGGGGQGGADLDTILEALRADRDAALLSYSASDGWPIKLPEGYLFVSADPAQTLVAGDHDNWSGTPLTADKGFQWAVVPGAAPGGGYKFKSGADFVADPWARSYIVDGFGELSLIQPAVAHIDRYYSVGDAIMAPRPLRVWVPEGSIDRVLYAHDGQNLFYDGGIFGSWHLEQSAPPGVLIVGIDNTEARLDEYTHVTDDIEGMGQLVGGEGDAYADFLDKTVRPLIQAHYGEPGPLGVMGSSLGGLISLHIADRYPQTYAFTASLSGTLGWGSLDPKIHNPTIIERYAMAGHRSTVIYLDSGGGGVTCADSDGDGINDDDGEADDNYCETLQMRDTLLGLGYQADKDLFYYFDMGAPHNEAAWAARVDMPLGIFAGL
jgi:hypothetical protein